MNVKKLRYFAFALIAVAFCACQKEPSTSDLHRDYLVYTAHDTGTDFAAIDTYYIPDSILIIGNSDKTEYWKDADAMAQQLVAKGYAGAKAIIGDGKMRVSIQSCATEKEAYRALNLIRQNEAYKSAWVLKR